MRSAAQLTVPLQLMTALSAKDSSLTPPTALMSIVAKVGDRVEFVMAARYVFELTVTLDLDTVPSETAHGRHPVNDTALNRECVSVTDARSLTVSARTLNAPAACEAVDQQPGTSD
jgi:hypothetical protein